MVQRYVHPTAAHQREAMKIYEQSLISTDESIAEAQSAFSPLSSPIQGDFSLSRPNEHESCKLA
jgi:hypothetical protein